MDYNRHLVLYSGGADSTYFIEQEPTARHLIHYVGYNKEQTNMAVTNANLLNRYLTVVESAISCPKDGETNQIHALYDTQMALDAGIRALSHGMEGIVMCFNADDICIDSDALESIFSRTDPRFRVLMPLRNKAADEIRTARKASKLKSISCMNSEHCGYCAKCLKGH